MTVLFPLNCFFFQIVNFPGFVEENLDNIQLWPAEARTTQSLLLLIQDSEILLSVIPKVLFQLKKRFLKYIGIHSTLQFEESLQNCNKFCREVFMTRNFFSTQFEQNFFIQDISRINEVAKDKDM